MAAPRNVRCEHNPSFLAQSGVTTISNFTRITVPHQSGSGRLLWLDGARGIAAVAVMCYHYEELLHLGPLLSSAYLAVDLFFMMSGFVLSHSYEAKLRSGRLPTGKYMLSRAIRLYPTFLIALALGAAYYGSKIVLRTADAPDTSALMSILSRNLFFLPVTAGNLVPSGIYPLAPSGWSLATEVVASILYGVLLARASTRLLIGFAVAFGAVFLADVAAFGSYDLGWGVQNFVPGIFRTLFEFTTGILLYRMSSYSSAKRWLSPAVLLAAVTGVFVLVTSPSFLVIGLSCYLLFPAFILSAEGRAVTGFLQATFHELGSVSYAVYLLHTPMFLWGTGMFKFATRRESFANASWLGWVLIGSTITASYVVARFIDEPVRAWLNGRMRSRKQPLGALAARAEWDRVS